ncbi:anaerobic ribonucleoside-triphosphate reductase activating protein [bacterium]|nr:anaerobic ribonucleoside-triphosphate reductase activating protein [bacterium]
MIIGGLQKVTLVDYPGKLACTVFLSGCNFRCPFCYSKELVLEEEIQKHSKISEDYFFDFLNEKKGMLEGCVICGGEPTVNGEVLVDFIKKIKKEAFLVKLDTNGSNPEMIKRLIDEKLIDYIAMDIKAPLIKEKYEQACGISFDISKIKESISIIKNSGIDYEFRTTVVFGIHNEEDIINIANEIAPADKYFVQRFRGEKGTINKKFESTIPFPDEFYNNIENKIKNLFRFFKIR